MDVLQTLKSLVTERLSAAAEEIFGAIGHIVTELEDEALYLKQEIDRQSRLLDMVLKPYIKLYRADVLVYPEQQNMNSSLVQEEPQPPQIKEQQDELLLSPNEGLTLLPVKMEDDGENRKTEPITITSAEYIETHADVKDFGTPQLLCKENSTEQQRPEEGLAAMRSEYGGDKRETEPVASTSTQPCDAEHCRTSQPTSDDQLLSSHSSESATEDSDDEWAHSSESATEDSDEWEETKEDQLCSESATEDSDEWEETKEDLKLKSQTTQRLEGHAFSSTLSQGLKSSKQTYTRKKRFICTHCGKKFNLKGDFKRHTMIHTGEKPFTCTVCGKGCCQKGDLKKHMMTHTGEYPFTCKVCGKGCIQIGHLKIHMRSHTGEKPFACKVCGNGFINKSNLKRHMRSHTGGQ